MATNNAINKTSTPLKSTAMTIDPGASGDSYIQFDINGTGEFRIGVDDTASDSFKMSQGSALGTNDAFIMTAAGERTLPLTPAFLAARTTADNNITGDGTVYTATFNSSEFFDQGGDFNGSTTFTASVTGRYALWFHYRYSSLSGSFTDHIQKVVTSNRTYNASLQSDINRSTPGTVEICLLPMPILADMDAADTVTFTVQWSGGGLTVDGSTSAGGNYIRVCGSLIC